MESGQMGFGHVWGLIHDGQPYLSAPELSREDTTLGDRDPLRGPGDEERPAEGALPWLRLGHHGHGTPCSLSYRHPNAVHSRSRLVGTCLV
jgi:hypothetical protein